VEPTPGHLARRIHHRVTGEGPAAESGGGGADEAGRRRGESLSEMISWPEGRRFAFTVFDDSDWTTLENGPPVYDFLRDQGFLTTKSVWPIAGDSIPSIGGSTCDDPAYLAWVQRLQREGFEIGLHNVTYHSSERKDIIRGLKVFIERFGSDPRCHANHHDCLDALYFGSARLGGLRRMVYNLLTIFKDRRGFSGHREGSTHFWGDLCRDRISYVRNFVFSDINTLRACPPMPYHDPQRPYVRYWFASSEGSRVDAFNHMLREENQDRLEEEGGLCIMYTHFGADFFREGHLDQRFVQIMKRLSRKNGWFVPVATVLDHILDTRGPRQITSNERSRLEWQWLSEKIRFGTT
jgi:hypothetical protein